MSAQPLVRLTLPGRVAVKKNGQRIYGRRRVLSPQYQRWERTASLAAQRTPGWTAVALIDEPVRAVFRLYYANRQWESDCSNAVEGPQDLLVKLGVLKDDKLIYRLEVEKHFGHEPRVEIEIYKHEQEELK